MDNPEKHARLGTRHKSQINKAKTTTQTTKTFSNMNPTKTSRVKPGA
jgi:hypothetical protein